MERNTPRIFRDDLQTDDLLLPGASHADGDCLATLGVPEPAAPTQEKPSAEPDLRALAESRPYIVGIGASAGGLEALENFFDNMPEHSGMAFVVVQHLSPDFKSVMDELLSRHTQMPIYRVTDGMQVEPNSVYLIPPKKEMIISGGRLLLSDKNPDLGLTLPIDIFLRSLAQDAGPRAVGVILSGTGSDGSRGIGDIKAAGGFVIAQDLHSAKFDGMPRSAVETGHVDQSLPPEQMSSALLHYIDHPSAYEMEVLSNELASLEGLDAVFQLLRKNYDLDFSYYKRTTVTRRVQRRLQMNQITDLEDYVSRLRSDPNELNLLYRDLLIGVTKFFRDVEAFKRLECDVIPELIANARGDAELRLWVAGCATGEEAYSLAILLHEQLERAARPVKAKIFATDVHQASLHTASLGLYNVASFTEVSPERMARYFTTVKGGYQVTSDLRQMIVFAPHNIIKDAPFTKIDLITCRNLLIYLEPPAQKKVLSLFHFALNTGGVLLLGPSESPGELTDEFTVIDDRWKVYRKRRDRRLPIDTRMPLSVGNLSARGSRGISPAAVSPLTSDAPLLRVYDELLGDFAPPSLLVDNQRQLLQSFSGAAEFLRLRDGRPSSDVCELVLPDLKIPIATALQQAAQKRLLVSLSGIRVHRPQGDQLLKLTVKPIPDRRTDGEYFLVILEPLADSSPLAAGRRGAMEMDLQQASQDQFQTLEAELRYTRENLQATVEEMETSNEELQATNEELVASNEELQSTNEELHSVNEELYTVNAEYQKKIAELTELTADMDNLLCSTEVGVIFLDRDLCIRKFTPKIADVFHLLPVDIGRRIDSFSHTIHRQELLDDIKRVLQDGQAFETEVNVGQSMTYLLRIVPYHYKAQSNGVVLTLIDISQLKRAENELRLMSKVFLDDLDPIVIEELDGRIRDVNAEAVRVYGFAREELRGKQIEVLIPPEERERTRELRARCLKKGGLRNIETWKQNCRGERIPVLLTLSLLTDQSGRPVAIASGVKDITEQKRNEQLVRSAVQKRDKFLAMLSHELRNPLGAALNASFVLDVAGKGSLPDAVKAACGVIQRQTMQVARLLDDLLDVSRITEGKIRIRREVVDLTQLCDDAIQAVRPQIDHHGQQLQVDVPSAPVLVMGDASRLLQILENLLANAAKYTPAGGRIRLSIGSENQEAVIRVADNGKGISPEMLENIFEMFYQVEDSLDRGEGGMGIGLTLVRTLVELQGGRVSASSQGPGQGSEFVVRLPLLDAPLPPTSPVVEWKRAPQRVIVVVEDNEDSRQMLETLLKLEGHQVSVAKDGRQGLEMIRNVRPDVAIIDIGLPEVSGFEVAQQVRQEFAGRPIYLIALTGYGRTEDREAVVSAGFDAHLVKPLKPNELAQLLSQLDAPRTEAAVVSAQKPSG